MASRARDKHGALRSYAVAKPGAYENEPWDGTLVCKVGGKIFVFFGSADASSASMMVSCGPEAAEWRARYPSSVSVAPYVGRYGWNSVLLDGDVPLDELHELIDVSYERVVAKLPKSRRPAVAAGGLGSEEHRAVSRRSPTKCRCRHRERA